jgi:hypothetical protein
MRLLRPALSIMVLCSATTLGWSQALTVKLEDPAGDVRSGVDVTELELTFLPSTGVYFIRVRTTPQQPFDDRYVRLNINLFNPDAPSADRLFHDTLNDHPIDRNCVGPNFPLRVRSGSTDYPLFGTNPILKRWKAGDRVSAADEFNSANTTNSRAIVVDVVRSPDIFRTGIGPAGSHQIPTPYQEDRIESVGVLQSVPNPPSLPLYYGLSAAAGIFHNNRPGWAMGPLAHAVSDDGAIDFKRTVETLMGGGITEVIQGAFTTANTGSVLSASAAISTKNARQPAVTATACSFAIHRIQPVLAPDSPATANLFARIQIQGATQARSSAEPVTTVHVGTEPEKLKTYTSSGKQNRQITVELGRIDTRRPFNLFLAVIVRADAINARGEASAEAQRTLTLEEIRLTSGSFNSTPVPILGFTSDTGLQLRMQDGSAVPVTVKTP